MNRVINIYKPLGLTPKQLIEKFRIQFPEYKDTKIGFAGRLDPMAHGVMLLMIGEATKERNKYLNLDKEYEFEVLLGVSTDTYDALGIINNGTNNQWSNPDLNSALLEINIKQFIKDKLGRHSQAYPPFSSKTVDGKPLYWYARNNKLSEIKIPKREIEIYDFDLIGIKKVKAEKVKKIIFENINKVDGDFRQKEILKKWEQFFSDSNNETMEQPALPAGRWNNFSIAKFRILCSSGTYVRSLADELGRCTKSGAITLDILRTKVGKFNINNHVFI
jgi:tRNA pseudouridine(55) synthase